MSIYIQGRKYARTDKAGNFNKGNFFDTEPGMHHIQLKHNNKVMSSAKINILEQRDVACFGKLNMRCKQNTI